MSPDVQLPETAFPDLFRDEVFTLETARLFLRWPKASDSAAITALAGDERVAAMTGALPHPYPRDEALRFILSARTGNADGAGLALAIAARAAPERLLGMIGLRRVSDGGIALGYWLGHAYWGQGLGTEAAQAMVDAVFLYTPWHQVTAAVRVTNAASRTVLERCGFQFEVSGMLARPARGDAVPGDTYRLTRQVWLSLKGWRAPVPMARMPLPAGAQAGEGL